MSLVFRSPQGLVARPGAGSDGVPWPCVPAGRDHDMSTTVGNRIVALSGAPLAFALGLDIGAVH